jgi:hypothetical protein
MKKILLCIFIIHCFGNLAHAAFFNQGNNTTLTFSTLPYISATGFDTTSNIIPGFESTLDPGTGIMRYIPILKDGDFFRLDLYVNRSDTTPVYSNILSNRDSILLFTRRSFVPIIGGPNPSVKYGPLLWADLEGKIFLFNTFGSMTLDHLTIRVSPGNKCIVTHDVTTTPIPAAAWLFGSGLAGLVGLRKRISIIN